MNPILQIVIFLIAIIICMIGILKPEKLLDTQYWWRMKGETEYSSGYLITVRLVSSVIALVSIFGIVHAASML